MAGCGPVTLENIQIAAPCSATWADMSGDARVRHCQFCQKNVYNLSEMTRAQAEALIQQKEGKLCIRFYQRADGTILTDNCPVGLRAIRRRMRWIGAGMAAFFAFGATAFWARASAANGTAVVSLRQTAPFTSLQGIQPFKAIIDWVDPIRVRRTQVMGEMMIAPRVAPAPVPPAATSGN